MARFCYCSAGIAAGNSAAADTFEEERLTLAAIAKRRSLVRGSVVLTCTALAAHASAQVGISAKKHADPAQSFPLRPIRFIVASPPGGPADIVSRLIGPKLTDAWGQPVVIDNRAGANGIIGSTMVARAAADGYTIVMVAAGLAINPLLYRQVPYDPIKDFTPITQAISVPNVLVVHPSLPVASVPELVALAKAKQGALAFASAGKGSTGHLAGELFRTMAGVPLTHVPYKGGAPAIADVVAGQVPMAFSITLAALPYVRSGRLRALAVTSAARSAVAPEVPTMAESGFPGFEVTGWFGVLAPAATPRPIVLKLNRELVRILNEPEVRDRLIAQGADPAPGTPEQFSEYIRSESQRWSKLIQSAALRGD